MYFQWISIGSIGFPLDCYWYEMPTSCQPRANGKGFLYGGAQVHRKQVTNTNRYKAALCGIGKQADCGGRASCACNVVTQRLQCGFELAAAALTAAPLSPPIWGDKRDIDQ